jgi:hypothetical protein
MSAERGTILCSHDTMNDFICIGVLLIFFVASAAYLRGCEAL